MAKEHNLHPVLLFAISCALLCAGWLMKSFPAFIFGGLAPLFAMTDRVPNEGRVWNRAELILIALALGLLAAHGFQLNQLAISIVEAIALTLAFLGYSFAHQRVGGWIGKFTIILFWLSIEYIFLKLPWHDHLVLLGDALALKPGWMKWASYTGYLGPSLWILVANLLLYVTLLRGEKVNWIFLFFTVLWITGPIVFSLLREQQLVSGTNMITPSSHKVLLFNESYLESEEVIPVTAVGISVLILLSAVVRNKALRR